MDTRSQAVIGSQAGALVAEPGLQFQPDALDEMNAVLDAHERHAIVLPRSNRSGPSRVPVVGPELPPDDAFRLWTRLRDRLAQYQTVPYAAAPCMLIRKEIIERFGPIDMVEGARAYSERINRYGYSTVVANRAFVRADNAAMDLYEPIPADTDPVDYFGSLELPHRPRILYDLYHLAPHYYGTADFGLNLLRELHALAGKEFEIWVAVQKPAADFFLPELQGYPLHREDARPKQLFDVAFKPTQMNSWREFERMSRLAPRLAYTILDMIAVRCSYLSQPGKASLFREVAELCDRVFTLSESVQSDFAALTGSAVHLEAVHLGTNYGVSADEYCEGKYVLLIGNSYAHKGLAEALQAVAQHPWPVVVVGIAAANAPANIMCLQSGSVSRETMRELLANARVVVYPSHYEGFGLPVLDAIALRKSVVVLDTGINREMEKLVGGGLCRITSIAELGETIERLWNRPPTTPARPPRNWRDAAKQYLTTLRHLLVNEVHADLLRKRWRWLGAAAARA